MIPQSKVDEVSFERLYMEYDSALRWISGFVDIRNTRLDRYRKYLSGMEKALIRNDIVNYVANIGANNVLAMQYEINSLIFVHSGLSSYAGNGLGRRLEKVVLGPDAYLQEKGDGGSRHGRDFTFELINAARFANRGLRIDLEDETDVIFFVEDIKCRVECKRPSSHKKVKECIKKAIDQLDRRYSDDSNEFGMVSLSLDKLINGEMRVLNAEGVHTMNDRIFSIVHQYMQKNVLSWLKKSEDPSNKLAGILASILIPARLIQQETLVSAGKGFTYPLCRKNSPPYSLLEAIGRLNDCHEI